MAISETALNRSLYTLDVLQKSVLYLLPNQRPDAENFTTTRFDPALDESPHILEMFGGVSNRGIKRCGKAFLYVRGANSRKGLKSIPVSDIVFDETDEMSDDLINLAFERTSGQFGRVSYFMLSTPGLPDTGINKYFNDSSQDHYMFPCPSCGRIIELKYPESLVIRGEYYNDPRVEESHLICYECKAVLPQETKPKWLNTKTGIWVPTYQNKRARGFYINQLYSNAITPVKLALAYHRAQISAVEEKEFYNSKLGLTYIPRGGQISDADIARAMAQPRPIPPENGETHPMDAFHYVTMGIDVGKKLHVEIDGWQIPDAGAPVCHTVLAVSIDNFEQLDKLLAEYKVCSCVIDIEPEVRKTLEFYNRHPDIVKRCKYVAGKTGLKIDQKDSEIQVHRAAWLDAALGRFMKNPTTITLPANIPEEYKKHLKGTVREVIEDSEGNPVARWTKVSDDHFAHARNYSEIAFAMAITNFTGQDIYGIF